MNVTKKVLENGLRLLTIPMKDTETVTVMVLVETGSKYETPSQAGLSHFLEHMCFKGTARRPKAMDISRELDGLGAQSNAFTSHEYTGYYAKAEARHAVTLVDILSDVYLHSTFPGPEIEKEKGVIVEEINMYEDMPQRHVQDLFMHLLYGDQPVGGSIAGTRESVRSFVRDDFVAYHDMHYVPEGTIVVIAGKIDEAVVVSSVTEKFGAISAKEKPGMAPTTDAQSSPAVAIKHRSTDQTHLVLGTRTFPVTDESRSAALTLMASTLAGGMSSRLFERLREDMGACYYVRAYNDAYSDHGFMEISVGADNKRVREIIDVILTECKRLIHEPIPEDELDRVKESVVGSMLLDLESSDAYANLYGGEEVLRRPLLTPREIEARLRAVTAEDIKRVAGEIWKTETLNLALIGPFEESDRQTFLSHLAL